MKAVRVALRDLSPVAFANAETFVVLDDDTVVIRDGDGDDIAAVHSGAWLYVYIEEAPS